MKKKTRRKKKKSFKNILKKVLLVFVIIAILVTFLFFFDRESFNNLKNDFFSQINKITNKIEKEINKYSNKNNESKYESIKLSDELMVFFLDVGQADSILIKSNDEFMLIDAGNNNDGEKLVNYFKYLQIDEFKYVIGTHAHEDHIGGMDKIINNFKIDNFYMPGAVTTTATFESVLDSLEKKNLKFQTPKIGSKLKLGNSTIEVISVKDKAEDLNDTSIVLKLTYQNISILFTGDATSNVEKEILDKNIESTVLKVGHHGSKYSNSANFLRKVNPKYAVISCGVNNDYYHPHKVVLEKLEKMNVDIYRTDLLGTIVLSSDGDKISFKNIKTYTDGGTNEKT